MAATVVQVRLDAGQQPGVIRKLNGVNLAPPTVWEKAALDLKKEFAALRSPLCRLHDAPLDNPGMKLVDIPQVFANFAADADDPANYYFAQTDDYIRNSLSCSTPVLYRLGISIEHSVNKYWSYPPADPAKWIKICTNIIRHYNEKWADGFEWNIEYWEIWNEPDLSPNMWTEDYASYIELYAAAAKALKARFPAIKIGGPAITNYRAQESRALIDFLEGCRRAGAPLDFLSWHCYSADPDELIAQPEAVRKIAAAHGYPDVELQLNEWHYFNGDWRRLRSDPAYCRECMESLTGFNGTDAAAFIGAVLTGWQDSPLTMGMYYAATVCAGWGLFDQYGIARKTYYAMRAFGEMTAFPERLWAISDGAEVRVLAGRNQRGQYALLISCFKSPAETIKIDLGDAFSAGKCTVFAIDAERDFEVVSRTVEDGKLRINRLPGSSVYLVQSV